MMVGESRNIYILKLCLSLKHSTKALDNFCRRHVTWNMMAYYSPSLENTYHISLKLCILIAKLLIRKGEFQMFSLIMTNVINILLGTSKKHLTYTKTRNNSIYIVIHHYNVYESSSFNSHLQTFYHSLSKSFIV